MAFLPRKASANTKSDLADGSGSFPSRIELPSGGLGSAEKIGEQQIIKAV
jgi:hypothetical protein